MLGTFAQITLGVLDFSSEVNFLEQLGFKKISSQSEPYPSALFTDGNISYRINSYGHKYLGLNYFTDDLHGLVSLLEAKGIDFFHKSEDDDKLSHALFRDENGFGVGLFPLDPSQIYEPAGFPLSNCGKFGEFSIAVKDLASSFSFWTSLGFKGEIYEGNYPWSIIFDGKIVLGLHQTTDFSDPTITFFDINMKDKIAQLKIDNLPGLKDSSFGEGFANITSPNGHHFFLFTGQIEDISTL